MADVMQIMYDCVSDAAVLTGTAAAMPLTNLQDPRPETKWRSVDLDEANTQFDVTLTASTTLRGIFLGGSNMNQSGEISVLAYSDAARTAVTFDSGFVIIGAARQNLVWGDPAFWTGRTARDDPDGLGIDISFIFATQAGTNTVTAKYWRIKLRNGAHADGYLEAGRLYMGRSFIPTYNYAVSGNSFNFNPLSTTKRSPGGTLYTNRRRISRSFQFGFPQEDDDVAWGDIYRLINISNVDRQVVIVPDPSLSIAELSKRAFLGTLGTLPNFSTSGDVPARVGMSMQVTEAT